jgi:hypothetical protein
MKAVQRNEKRDFSRKRKISFKNLMFFMLSMVKESSQNVLERFFPKMKNPGASSWVSLDEKYVSCTPDNKTLFLFVPQQAAGY